MWATGRRWGFWALWLLAAGCEFTSSESSLDEGDGWYSVEEDGGDVQESWPAPVEPWGSGRWVPVEAPDLSKSGELPAAQGCETSSWARVWSTEFGTFGFVYGSPPMSLSPGGGLLLRGGGGDSFFRMSDGRYLGADIWRDGSVMDPDWRRRVEVIYSEVEPSIGVVSTVTDQLLNTIAIPPAPDGAQSYAVSTRVVSSRDATSFASVTCWASSGESEAVLRIRGFDPDSGELGPVVDIPARCSFPQFPAGDIAVMAPNGRWLVVAPDPTALLCRVDLLSGDFVCTDALDGRDPQPTVNGFDLGNRRLILAASIAPDSSVVAVSQAANQIRFFRLPGLEPLEDTLDTARAGINEFTYGPSEESPLAYDPSGDFLGHLDGQGEAVLTDLRCGRAVAHFPRPPLPEDSYFGEHTVNPATAMIFSPDGRGLVVSFERGMEYWRCAGTEPEVPAYSLDSLTVEGPVVAALHEALQWKVSAQGQGQPILYQFHWGSYEEPIQTSLSGSFSLTNHTPGAFPFWFGATDGFSETASEVMLLLVE